MALITNRARTATVYALRDTHLLRLSTDAFTQLSAEPSGVGAADQHRDGRPPPAIAGAGPAELAGRQHRAAAARSGARRSREFGDRLERSLARLTGSARQVDAAAAAAARRGPRGPRVRPDGAAISRPRTRSSSTTPTRSPRPGPGRASARPTCSCSSRTPRLARSARRRAVRPREPRDRAQPHRARAGPPDLDRGPARHVSLAREPPDRPASPRPGDRTDDVDRVARLAAQPGDRRRSTAEVERGVSPSSACCGRCARRTSRSTRWAGTSIGSIIGGATASDMDLDMTTEMLREALVHGKSPVDFTFPAVSIATGARVSQRMKDAARGLDIEDAWINGFCVSTNITRGEVEIHRSGPAWLGPARQLLDPRGVPSDAHDRRRRARGRRRARQHARRDHAPALPGHHGDRGGRREQARHPRRGAPGLRRRLRVALVAAARWIPGRRAPRWPGSSAS